MDFRLINKSNKTSSFPTSLDNETIISLNNYKSSIALSNIENSYIYNEIRESTNCVIDNEFKYEEEIARHFDNEVIVFKDVNGYRETCDVY